MVTFVFTLSVVSCSDGDTAFSYCELRIGLDEDFYTVENENFDAVYSNGKYTVAILRISFVAAVSEGIPETMTPYEFGEFWIQKCAREANLIKDGSVYCEYYDYGEDSEDGYFYLESFYRSAYAYFVILFAVDSDLEQAGRADFLRYAESVNFTN